jgi:1-acyl-sn-glycerol-3-phosphate acyltransferase
VFIIYGYLGRNFKWMMKRALRKMPFVGAACAAAHHIFVDKSGPRKVKQTYDQARATLKDGMSLVVFPEGARTFTGHMGVFRRGAFMLADELQLPVCPLTINGSFDVLPRMRDGRFVSWHPLRLTIHEPIMPQGNGPEALQQTMSKAYDAIMESLDEQYKGFRENPDQK